MTDKARQLGEQPAFPVPEYIGADGDPHFVEHQGISTRTWLAGMAMQGLMVNQNEWAEGGLGDVDAITKSAFAMADAMIKQEAA